MSDEERHLSLVEGEVPRTPTTIEEARKDLLQYWRDSTEKLIGAFGSDQDVAEWAEGSGYVIVGYARDVKVHSQSPPMGRPGFSAAVRAIEEGHAAGLVAVRLHRFGRGWETQDEALRRVWEAGGRVFTVDYGEWKPDRPGTAQYRRRRRQAKIDAAEIDAICDRLQTARNRKMRVDQGYGGGNRFGGRPYGRVLLDGDYVPVPEEQAVIRRLCAAHEAGESYCALARALNAEGVLTVTGKPWSHKTVRGLVKLGPVQLRAASPTETLLTPLEWAREATG